MFGAVIFLIILATTNADVNPRYRPLYHLAPPEGWMNDPNGFSYFQGKYHLFYQFNPNSSQDAGIAHWGHATSDDLFNWKHEPIALYPDKSYDRNGVFSGSAISINNTFYVLYTGNVNYPGQSPDHQQEQNLASSTDGVNFIKYENNPVMSGVDLQPDFRDPKMWLYEDTVYVVMGHSEVAGDPQDERNGRVVLFSSKDLINWRNEGVLLASDGSMGYMWECPDFFELDGFFLLMMSPQGIQPQNDRFRNLYQTGYFAGHFNYDTVSFNPLGVNSEDFRMLDHGHDLYAAQSMLTPDGRRVLIAWMDMWERVYPERDDGWTGQMTTPRELRVIQEDGSVQQAPMREYKNYKENYLFSGQVLPGGEPLSLGSGAAEIRVRWASGQFLRLRLQWDGGAVIIDFKPDEPGKRTGTVTLDRGLTDGVRSSRWETQEDKAEWLLLIDSSSIELFCAAEDWDEAPNGMEWSDVVFSSRFFPSGGVTLGVGNFSTSAPDIQITSIHRSVSES